jgi:hypothetical protein
VSLVLADVEAAALDGAVAKLTSEGINATGVICDVRSLTDVERLAEADEAAALITAAIAHATG